MKKLCIVLLCLFISNSAFAKKAYVILEDNSDATEKLVWFKDGNRLIGPTDPETKAKVTSIQNLRAKLEKTCRNSYKGSPADVLCVTDLSVTPNFVSNDSVPSIIAKFANATIEGKMYCTTDEENLLDWDNTIFGNTTDGNNFDDCQLRIFKN